jgi:hypothetical protein
VWVRSGGFFDDNDPPEPRSFSTAIAMLLSVIPMIFAMLMLLALVFLSTAGP